MFKIFIIDDFFQKYSLCKYKPQWENQVISSDLLIQLNKALIYEPLCYKGS